MKLDREPCFAMVLGVKIVLNLGVTLIVSPNLVTKAISVSLVTKDRLSMWGLLTVMSLWSSSRSLAFLQDLL